jgi:nicotinamidase-related amidase
VSAEEAKTYDTVIFEGPPPMKQRLWPRHCVQDSWGAELHKDLKVSALKSCWYNLLLYKVNAQCHGIFYVMQSHISF